MPSHMKLSDAIMLNGMTKPQGFGPDSIHSHDAPCAIGGALQVIGKQDTWAPYSAFESAWPWTLQPFICPTCTHEGCGTQTIFHLNDHHQWTRQQIAEWAARIESQEPTIPELIEIAERIVPSTCEATVVRHVEDEGVLCGKKCEPGKDYCLEHYEE